MPNEEDLVKSSLIDQLALEKGRKRLAAIEEKRKKTKERKELLNLASLERFLSRRLDYSGKISGLKNLDPKEIISINKVVRRDAVWKSLGWSSVSLFVAGAGLLLRALDPLVIISLFSPIFGAVALRYLWFIARGFYLGCYCKSCMAGGKGTSFCHCTPNEPY